MAEDNPFENFEVPPFNELMSLEPHGPDVYVVTRACVSPRVKRADP